MKMTTIKGIVGFCGKKVTEFGKEVHNLSLFVEDIEKLQVLTKEVQEKFPKAKSTIHKVDEDTDIKLQDFPRDKYKYKINLKNNPMYVAYYNNEMEEIKIENVQAGDEVQVLVEVNKSQHETKQFASIYMKKVAKIRSKVYPFTNHSPEELKQADEEFFSNLTQVKQELPADELVM